MARKVIFLLASILVFGVLDGSWVYPGLLNSLPLVFGWTAASFLAGLQILALIVEWNHLDSDPLPNPFESIHKNRRRFQNLKSDR